MHVPVMLREATTLLVHKKVGLWVDATVGDGGHADALLAATAPDGELLGLDWDPAAVACARSRLARYRERVRIVCANYTQLPTLIPGAHSLQGILLDAGISSSQLDDAGRGFSFQRAGPLDMRMTPELSAPASGLVNALPYEELARLLSRYGEERHARRIARAIVRERQRGRIETTRQLTGVIESTRPPRFVKTAARVFQALRIAVNDELGNLERFLDLAPGLLSPGGRMVVISYHSLEDRLVKGAFRRLVSACVCPPELPRCVCGGRARARLLTRRVLRPGAQETRLNPRSRSARLRALEVIESRA